LGRAAGMKAKERARLLSGAAAILLCIKLVIVAHGSLRIGAASLLQRQDEGARGVQGGDPLASSKQAGIKAGSSTLSSCCHSQCNGLKDSVRHFSRLAPGGRKLQMRRGHHFKNTHPHEAQHKFLGPEEAMREPTGTLLIMLPCLCRAFSVAAVLARRRIQSSAQQQQQQQPRRAAPWP
jgi:hypothetical protein